MNSDVNFLFQQEVCSLMIKNEGFVFTILFTGSNCTFIALTALMGQIQRMFLNSAYERRKYLSIIGLIEALDEGLSLC